MICPLCERPIDPSTSAYRQVTGYVKRRAQGGPNTIALMKETGVLAHPNCVELQKAEVIPGQLAIE